MESKEKAKNKIGLEKTRASLKKRARNKRENVILVGFMLEWLCFVMFGFLQGAGIFLRVLKPISWVFLGIAFYLAFDVGNKIYRHGRLSR